MKRLIIPLLIAAGLIVAPAANAKVYNSEREAVRAGLVKPKGVPVGAEVLRVVTLDAKAVTAKRARASQYSGSDGYLHVAEACSLVNAQSFYQAQQNANALRGDGHAGGYFMYYGIWTYIRNSNRDVGCQIFQKFGQPTNPYQPYVINCWENAAVQERASGGVIIWYWAQYAYCLRAYGP